jgi:Pilus formation protein N terminal region
MYRVLDTPMSVWRRLPRPFRYLGYAVMVTSVLGLALANVARADTVTVPLDQAQLLRLPDGVSTIVIGNPLIADATLQPGGLLVITGKGHGATNLLALDRSGRVLLDKQLQVTKPRTQDFVVVQKGMDTETYSCTPECAPRVTLGDTPAYFSAVLGQTAVRSGQAGGAAAGNGGAPPR